MHVLHSQSGFPMHGTDNLAYVSHVSCMCQGSVLHTRFLPKKKLVFDHTLFSNKVFLEKCGKIERYANVGRSLLLLLFSVGRLVRESRKRAKVGRQLLVCVCVCVCVSIIAKFGDHESVKKTRLHREIARGAPTTIQIIGGTLLDPIPNNIPYKTFYVRICMRSYFHEATRS